MSTQYTLRDAVLPVPYKCKIPILKSKSSCPSPALNIATANDILWEAQTRTTDAHEKEIIENSALNRIADQLHVLLIQYGISRTNVTWEDIVKEVRNNDDSPLTRERLKELGYSRKSKFFYDSSFVKKLDEEVHPLLSNIIPISFDFWFPPTVSVLIVSCLFIMLLLSFMVGLYYAATSVAILSFFTFNKSGSSRA